MKSNIAGEASLTFEARYDKCDWFRQHVATTNQINTGEYLRRSLVPVRITLAIAFQSCSAICGERRVVLW